MRKECGSVHFEVSGRVVRRKQRHGPKEADASSATCGRGARRKRKGLPPVADANLRWLRLSNDSDAKNHGIQKCPSLIHMPPPKGRCAKGWGHVRDIRSPSRLPHVFETRHSPFYLMAKFERKWNVKSSNFCRITCKAQNIFVPLQSISKRCKAGKQKSWITQEKHHEKPANNKLY